MKKFVEVSDVVPWQGSISSNPRVAREEVNSRGILFHSRLVSKTNWVLKWLEHGRRSRTNRTREASRF